jgi:diacylglycerol kinase
VDRSLKRLVRSFGHAFRGLPEGFRGQQNIYLHLLAAGAVLGLAFWLRLDEIRLAILLFVILAVVSSEFLNSAMERLLDRIHPGRDAEIGRIKDLLAATVLINAVFAAATGLLILVPPLVRRIRSLIG